jgi:outer membrane protein assembly factor BamB
MFHTLHLSDGSDYQPPRRFLPPNANASGLVVVDSIAYVITQNGCSGVVDGVWSLDLATGKVSTWKASIAGTSGIAFGADGTIYATTGSSGESPNSLVALDRETLMARESYTADAAFSSSPVVFEFNGRVLVAATTVDGRVHVLDGARPGGSDHKTPLVALSVNAKGPLNAGALASWQDSNRTRWILVPGVPSPTGSAAVGAWRLNDQNGRLTLQPGWTSRGMTSPLPPTIINDVVFVTSGGLRTQSGSTLSRTGNPVIYALDGVTGEELWNSGALITSQPRVEALSGGVGQIYIGTRGGQFFAFGFPMEH